MKCLSRGRPRLSGSVRQIRVRSSVFLLRNARKASLGFGGAKFRTCRFSETSTLPAEEQIKNIEAGKQLKSDFKSIRKEAERDLLFSTRDDLAVPKTN